MKKLFYTLACALLVGGMGVGCTSEKIANERPMRYQPDGEDL